jgi:uncharacterized caspase-like protein
VYALTALGEPRHALLIGNTYRNDRKLALPTSANDVQDVGKALAGHGFEVIEAIGANRSSLNAYINKFSDKIAQARTGLAVLYYVGHGVHSNGQ